MRGSKRRGSAAQKPAAARAFGLLLVAAWLGIWGCGDRKTEPTLDNEPAIQRLEGAHAQIARLVFAPDGASVFAVEEQQKERRTSARVGTGTYAIVQRSPAGRAAKTWFTSAGVLTDIAATDKGVYFLERPKTSDEQGSGGKQEDRQQVLSDFGAAARKTALFRVTEGAPPERLSPEGQRCFELVASGDGRKIAYSLAPSSDPSPETAEAHVLDVSTGQDQILDQKGVVTGISADGSHVLLRKGGKLWTPFPDGLVSIRLRDQQGTDVPSRLLVEGQSVDTTDFTVSIAGDGLQLETESGETFRSAFDGSNARRVAPARLEGPKEADPDSDAPPRPRRLERRFVGVKGTLFALREEGATVALYAWPAAAPDKDKSPAPEATPTLRARFEGPISAFVRAATDPSETRFVMAVRSDTSRDGLLDVWDDATLYVTGKLSPDATLPFSREKVVLWAEELRPKIAQAAGVPESSVSAKPKLGACVITATLPWDPNEDPKAILNRVMAAARTMTAVVRDTPAHVRVALGPMDFLVLDVLDEVPNHVFVASHRIALADPEALTVILKNSKGTLFPDRLMLSGQLMNKGQQATPSIELSVEIERNGRPAPRGSGPSKSLGPIGPGKTISYTIDVPNIGASDDAGPVFMADGKPLSLFNEVAYEHSIESLRLALDLRKRFGVWAEHADVARESTFVVHLGPDHASMDSTAQNDLFSRVMQPIAAHARRYHRGSDDEVRVVFAAPSDTAVWVAGPTAGIISYNLPLKAVLKDLK